MINPNHTQKPATNVRAGCFLRVLLLAGMLAASSPAQILTVLDNFRGAGNTAGSSPEGTLILGPDNMLYGTAPDGGVFGAGTVFKIQTNGMGLTVIWSFTDGADGASPFGGLVLSGGTLYGTTISGGISNVGTIFAVNTNGSGFTNLYSFLGGDDGANPVAGLLLSDGTLYGTASAGGSSLDGTVFAVGTNGSNFVVLKTFSGSDGADPEGKLVLSGSELFGTTYAGGVAGLGTVFEISTNGGGFASRYSFRGGLDCGNPYAGLLLAGDVLYGTTTGLSASISDYGSIFKITTSGTGFTVLKTFEGGDGANPYGGLVLSGSELYGTTESGTPGYGTVFKLTTGGGSFTTLYSFGNGSDGGSPYGGLVLSGSALYGSASGAGADGYGTLFEVNTSASGFNVLSYFPSFTAADSPSAPLVFSGGTLYGTATGGGSSGDGVVFSVNPDGGGFSVLENFSGANGSDPSTGLILANGVLYGTTHAGGAHGDGTVFEINTDGGGFTTLHSFAGPPSEGSSPESSLTLGGDGNFYGTTYYGGSSEYGTVFQITTNGTLTTLVSFTGANGSNPSAGLTPGSDGDLYGTTFNGGSGDYGTVFQMTTNGTLTTLVSFGRTNGANPSASLTLGGDGNFYGTTYNGGSGDYGTVFRITTNGVLTTLVSFAATNGANPFASLTLGSDGNFYGTTFDGGANSRGTVFQMTTNGTLTTLVAFANTNGAFPEAALTLGSDGNLYGTTADGGTNFAGTVFRLNVVPAFQPVSITKGTLSLSWSTLIGWNYLVQYNSDLSSSNWINLNSPATAIGATLSVTDSITNGPQRFYRVLHLP
jgi:uncharacterized repeat protein (TIGR03803 family)